MEYQFTHSMHGVVAKCSMDHEAFSRWLNIEVVDDPNLLEAVFEEIKLCKASSLHEAIFEGSEYSLYMTSEEVVAKANNLEITSDELDKIEDGFNFYNEESIAFCGLEDFEQFLLAYKKFIQTYH
ncbi:YacL family protein [Otariodibacter oris]|uniref:UPF0231 protein DES31_1362 n=1 Tax=Otariodibacter oris TaxID=1032623 RepID=A0A420XFQ6_9PAST|nr:YacL family protein [Otariodibacter oris]QGM80264.1 hypothetical protein A6A10_02065 [Otariodibacter oris]RKR71630.1 hypothetical protein DES31_1362 [Otariodibacter oris]